MTVICLAFVMPGCAGAAPGTIGAVLGKRTDGRLFVRGVPAGQAAAKAGLEEGDEILAIDGRLVHGMSEDDIRRAVRGDVGSAVNVTIDREGVRRDIRVERSPLLGARPPEPARPPAPPGP